MTTIRTHLSSAPNPAPQMFAYHETAPGASDDIYTVTPVRFLQHLWTMQETRKQTNVPFAVSFDDGHRSNIELAVPLMELLGLRGYFFVPSMWVSARPNHMTWNDLSALAKDGHKVGSHGATHTFLTHCEPERLREELYRSRTMLEQNLQTPISTISMPGGRWNAEVLHACAAAGYQTVYTSEPGYYCPPCNGQPEVIGRFAVRRTTSLKTIAAYAAGRRQTVRWLREMYRARGRVKQLLGDDGYQKLWTHFFRATAGERGC